MTKLRTVNWVYLAAVVIVYGFMAGAAWFSYHHIVDLFLWLGCSRSEARWAPVFIDGMAMLGWLGRRSRSADVTRRGGMWLMAGAGTVSLACNIGAGHTWGSRAFGVIVVGGFVVAETFADRLRPRPKQATPDEQAAAELAAKRSAAAVKAAATRKANAAKTAKPKVPAQRKPRTRKPDPMDALAVELEAMVRGELAEAPVSPAPIG